MKAWFDKLSCALAGWVGSPYALVMSGAFLATGFWLWNVDQVNIAVSIFSLGLLIVLQASQNRDGAALQAKLDEIIKALPQADNKLRHLDEKTIDEVREVRQQT